MAGDVVAGCGGLGHLHREGGDGGHRAGAGPGGHLRQPVERADVALHEPGQARRPAAPAVVGPEGGVEAPPADPEPAAVVAEEVAPAVDAGHGAVERPDPAAGPGPADTDAAGAVAARTDRTGPEAPAVTRRDGAARSRRGPLRHGQEP